MHTQLNYLLAEQHSADLQRAAQRARSASDMRAARISSRHPDRTSRLSALIARLTGSRRSRDEIDRPDLSLRDPAHAAAGQERL